MFLRYKIFLGLVATVAFSLACVVGGSGGTARDTSAPANDLDDAEQGGDTDLAEQLCPAWRDWYPYEAGDVVYWATKHWRASWYTVGEEPGLSDWDGWREVEVDDTGHCVVHDPNLAPPDTADPDTDVGTEPDELAPLVTEQLCPSWIPHTSYATGEIVWWEGAHWRAAWWTATYEPGTTGDFGEWRIIDRFYESECASE